MKGSKERIKKTARLLFSKRGFDGVSVRDIAREARVNVGAVSYHFGGKEELFRTVVREGLEEVRNALQEHVPGDMPIREKAERLIEAFFEAHLREDSVGRIQMAEMMTGGDRLHEPDGEHYRKMFEFIAQLSAQYDPLLTLFSFVSLPLFLVFSQPIVEKMRGEKGYSKEFIRQVAQHTVRIFFDGIQAEKEAQKAE